MANKKEAPTNIVDAYINYAVNEQIKAADVPPRKRLDINFSNASKVGNTKSKTNQEAYEKSSDQLYEDKPRNSISWRRYVVYMILITMLSCCFTYSKYMSAGSGSSTFNTGTFNCTISTKDGSDSGIKITQDALNESSISFTSNEPKKFVFIIDNTKSDVDVTVNSTCASISGFNVSFVTEDETASANSIDVDAGQQGRVKMIVTPSTTANEASGTLSLNFNVEQKN